jgi:transposase-like protein
MRFTEEEKLTILAEGEKTGVKTVCAKYDISDQAYRRSGATRPEESSLKSTILRKRGLRLSKRPRKSA